MQNITQRAEDSLEDKTVIADGADYAVEIDRVFDGKFLDGALLYDVGKLVTG